MFAISKWDKEKALEVTNMVENWSTKWTPLRDRTNPSTGTGSNQEEEVVFIYDTNKLKEDNAKYRKDNAKLEENIKNLKEDNDKYREDSTKFEQYIRKLTCERSDLFAKVATLEEELQDVRALLENGCSILKKRKVSNISGGAATDDLLESSKKCKGKEKKSLKM